MYIQATPSTSLHWNGFTSAPETLHINHKSVAKTHSGKFMEGTKLCDYKFPGEYKNLLAYCLLSASYIFKLEEKGQWLVIDGGVRSHLQASQREAKPPKIGGLGGLQCQQHSMFLDGAKTRGQKVVSDPEVWTGPSSLCLERAGALKLLHSLLRVGGWGVGGRGEAE